MGDSGSSSSNAVDQTSTTTLPEASAEEKTLRQQFGGLSAQQIAELSRQLQLFGSGGSPLQLSSGDHVELNKAYNAARDRWNLDSKDYADFLAGSRGLRLSDTPISQQAMQRQGLGLAEIESNRAMAGLDLGLKSNQYRLNLAQGLPGAGAFQLGNYLQERSAQPTTKTVGTGYVQGSQSPSGLQTGAAIAGGVGTLAMGAAAAFAI